MLVQPQPKNVSYESDARCSLPTYSTLPALEPDPVASVVTKLLPPEVIVVVTV